MLSVIYTCNSNSADITNPFKFVSRYLRMIEIEAEYWLKNLLAEDLGFGDITSQLLKEEKGSAFIMVKEDCVLSGLKYVEYLFELRGLQVELLFQDGEFAREGDKILKVSGLYRNIFEVERTALNLLTRMSGIATQTHELIEKVKKVNPHCRVASTRKTVLKFFDKEAVVTGGGDSHRFRLDDMILIKDNHVRVLGIEEALKRARRASFSKKVEIEVSKKEDAVKAVECGADIVMLDNMQPETARETVEAVRRVNPHILVEASGEITEENIGKYVEAGADIISLGCITHSVKAVNMSLEVSC